MISIFSETINDIPSLIVVDGDKQNAPLPVLLYDHGFTSAKEHNLPIAYLLAEKGYRVVLPDSLHHGERTQGLSMSQLQLAFWDIVIQNIADINTIYSWLGTHDLILDGRIGIAGTSMGGITASAALTQYAWIKAAVVMMGTPNMTDYADILIKQYRQSSGDSLPEDEVDRVYKSIEPIDLSKHMDVLNERPLFFWHGDKDAVVPFDQSHGFYKQAVQQYEHVDRIYFLKEKNQGHKVSRFGLLAAVQWLNKHL